MMMQAMKEYVLFVVLVITLLYCSIDKMQGMNWINEADRLPRFENYSVNETWLGPAVSIKLKSSSDRRFRTQLKEAAQKPPNFAGHYQFAIWGCGTRCASGAIINFQTGEISTPPLGGKAGGEEKWIFCTDWSKERGAEYYVNSSLLILRCGHKYGDNQDDIHYLIWKDNSFQQILLVSGKKLVAVSR